MLGPGIRAASCRTAAISGSAGACRYLSSTTTCLKDRSSSSSQWLQRQRGDHYVREARLQNLRSRAAFKLIEMDKKFKLFRKGMTVVDLGWAPGSWSQVAAERTQPNGRVIGVDILPLKPPKGVSVIQGNFLSKSVHDELKKMLADPALGRPLPEQQIYADKDEELRDRMDREANDEKPESYIDLERHVSEHETAQEPSSESSVDIVLSDMCEPWPQEHYFWLRSVNDPYIRMQNTSGLAVRDHGASIDLCDSALIFALDTLKPGGSFICKFYTGPDDVHLEKRLRKTFKKVKREKPDATRQKSREMYFVCQHKRPGVTKEDIFH